MITLCPLIIQKEMSLKTEIENENLLPSYRTLMPVKQRLQRSCCFLAEPFRQVL